MKIVVDMNLSPAWVAVLVQAGHTAVHWSSVGHPGAQDREILEWAREQHHVVFTHDLDFGAILAATDANAPSVLQIRTQDPTPEDHTQIIVETLARYTEEIVAGALLSIDENRARIRILPFRR